MKPSKQFSSASRFLVPLLGGILMGVTPAPVEAWFLAWIALVPLWFWLAKAQSIRQGALSGLVWGIGYHGLAGFWITGIHPMTWMGVPWLASLAIAIFCWTFLTLWGATLVAIWAALLFWIHQKLRISALVRVLMGTALWCGLESIWSAGSLWWTSLSYTQSPHNLVILHLGQLSGPATVTAAIVAVNGLVAEAWISYQHRKDTKELNGRRLLVQPEAVASPVERFKLQPATLLGMAAGLLIALHLIGFGLESRPLIQPQEVALNVGIVQGNIGNDIKLYTEGKRRALERYTNGYLKLANQGVDAVLTPEGALPFFLSDLKRQDFYAAILEQGVVAWVGAFGERGRSYTNSLFTIMGNGETFSRYDKAKLVPLGEYIPFESVLGGLIDRLSPLDAHLVAGSPTQLFETPFGRAIAGICYESAFAEHFRRQAAAGGQFILSSSNDAHYSSEMPAQHHAQDVMRAIETDRWAVRATNTGYSAIVDPHGRTLWMSGINTYETHAETIYRRQTETPYVRWGDWLTKILLGLAGVAGLFSERFKHQE
ncbi:apolipoprotein N-acyltransferase [Microcoleus sp. FACHB-53]|nr:apolipoprotein N-acyltransferase [Microcoleus sp. FACHB-53]